jgi:protoporphyrinogen oxidase
MLKGPRSRLLLSALLAPMLCIACAGSERAPEPEPEGEPEAALDVVIVGGGLAGLRAAYELQGRKVLLLEREPRLGGRVYTKSKGDTPYELGAIFAYDPRWLPRGSTASPQIPSQTRVGFSEGGTTRFADSAQDLVDALEGRSTGATRVTRHLAARRAFFGIIHPGPFDEYVYERQDDWRLTHSLRRAEGGNGELVEALARSSGAEITLGAEVSRIEETDDRVHIAYSHEGMTKTVTARAAIVATPANVATRLLGSLAENHPVSRIRYAPGVVVVLGVGETTLEPFSYVVSEDAGLSGVLSHSAGDVRVLTTYYARDAADAVESLDDEALIRHTVERLGRLGIGKVTPDDVRFSDVRRWQTLGTVIAEDPYASWDAASTRVSPRIVLAGDYTRWDAKKMPYGMAAAIESGERAGREIRALLSTGNRELVRDGSAVAVTAREAAALHARVGLPVPTPSRFAPLTICDVFELGSDAPRYLGRLDEGSVAPYGVLLLAEADDEIIAHLRESSIDGLWEYGPRYGVTSADSVLVLEGLFAAGSDEASIVASLDLIRERYFDQASGGFTTLAHGRAAYWRGPSVDTTAMIAHLMQRVAPQRYELELAAAARYLLSQQADDGHFEGRWFPSWVLPTSYAVRFLARRPDPNAEYRPAIERATQALVELQRDDGSVAGSVSETALFAMTLAVTRNHPEALAAAKSWITQQLERGVPAGDGFLYYWFESQGGARTFFHCRDRGRIAEAWARAALKDPPAPPPL